MPVDTQQYYGQTDPTTNQGQWNAMRFMIRQQMSKLSTSLPVEVVSVIGGGVAPVGLVNIRVLVASVTGDDRVVDYPEIPNVPYLRLQGGANAVILDPQPGDIGMACFCSRDISAVKNARKAAPPGSRRAYDFSDAMYCGGFLNAAPTQYIQFTEGGILVHSANGVKLGDTTSDLRKLVDDRFLELFNSHTHGGGVAPDQQMSDDQLTSTVEAN